jgi:hypothetical protein
MNAHRLAGLLAGLFALAIVLPIGSPRAAAADAIPEGATIAGNLSTDLDSGKVQAGDAFSLLIVRPYPNGDPSYAGAVVRGHIARVIKAGQGRKPEIDFAFDSIVLADGSSSPLTGHVLAVTPKKKSAALTQAAGAGIGMLVGNFIGKKLGTGLGGLAGAIGGFVYASNHKSDFVVPRGSLVTLQTDQEVPRPQARQ